MKPVKSMKRRIAIIALLLLLLPTLFCAWVVSSSRGLRWLLTQVVLPNSLQIDAIEGNLIGGGLHITGLRYHDDKVNITLNEAMLNWHPSALWRNELRVEMLYLQQLHIEQLTTDNTPLQLPDIHLPVTLMLDDMQVNDLEIALLQQPAIHFNNASLRAKANAGSVMVQYLEISNDTLQLTLEGTLHPYADYWHNLKFQWQLQLAELPTLNGKGQLKGGLSQTKLQHQLLFPVKLETELKLFDLLPGQLQTPHWQAQLQLPRQPLDAVDEAWPSTEVALTARGSGDMNHAAVDQFTLDALNSRVSGKGALDWRDKLQWQADVDSKKFDLAALWPLLNVQGPKISVGIKASLEGDLETLNANDVTIHALDGEIRGAAQVQWSEELQWQTQLQANNLELAQLWPLIYLDGQGLPPGRADLTTALSGDANGLSFNQLTLQTLGASVSGDGQLHWSSQQQPQLQWQAALSGAGVNPAVWQPQRLNEWQGDLATGLTIHGQLLNNEVQGELEIIALNGELRGYPIQLQSQLALAQQQLEIKSFDLHSAGSRIEMHGSAGDEMQLYWHLDSPQLEQLYPAAQGALILDGELRGPRAEPLLKLTIDGEGLAYAGQQIGALTGHAEVQLFSWRQILINLQANELQLAGRAIDELDIHSQGEAADHQLQLHLKMAELETQWRLNGAYDVAAQRWQGQIDEADLNNRDLGQWRIKSAAALNINRDQLTLAPLCWRQQASQLCLEGARQQDVWQATLRGQQLDLALLSPWLPRDLEIKGEAALNASLRYQSNEPLTAEAQINIGAGHVSYPIIEGDRSEWRFEKGRWQSTLDARGLRSQFHLALTGEDQIKAEIDLPKFNPLTTEMNNQPLRGSVQATISDLGLISNMLYEVQGLKGLIELDSKISGTVAQPTLTGQLQLIDGSLQIPRLGLSLTDVQFSATSTGNDAVNYRLKVHSGEGVIEATGQTLLNRSEGWPTNIALNGEMFEVSHIPEARVVINPNLTMKMARREIWLNGEILVPEARLQPKEFTSAVTVSDDVVIVGVPEPTLPPWKIHSRVRLILGDRVSLYGFGFEGTIGGNLLLIDEPGKVTAASGELNVVEGRYRAYGQRLEVEQGRLLFAGGPITNPALDLRAVRHIQEVTAGIKVYGPLRQPQFELFSIPAMDQTDVLAYLVLGTPLEQTTSTKEGAAMAQAALALGLKGGDVLARSLGDRFGIEEMRIESSSSGDQASLIMGRYLSPRLYVGYGVGLVEAVNTFNLRYQLSQHWQLKAESGASQGADMIFSIER
jgi:translocation and assembly module TamB